MSKALTLLLGMVVSLVLLASTQAHAQQDTPDREGYENFDAAIYARAYEVREMNDLNWLRERFEVMDEHLKVEKVYLETHRDTLIASDETLNKVKAFFAERGIETAGGITLTINESNRFETFCYSNPEHRDYVQSVVEHTAEHFDELILDDFFFTSCKRKGEIEAKGNQSWTDYRLDLMTDAAQELVIGPAKSVNEDVDVVIKYPNWYDHFHGLGFDLDAEPAMFDALYTGTETRDAVRSAQHLQPYHGYNIFRYFENLKPGHNNGGWVDTGGMRYLDRYAEQLWLTLFAKAPEITLFDFRQLQYSIQPEHRGPWQDEYDSSLDFEAVVEPYRQDDGSFEPKLTMARAAGYSLAQVDSVLGALGEPVGLKSYRPPHADGEDFLHSFLGMIGIPIELQDRFPTEPHTILLTEAAKHDSSVVSKIEQQLLGGKNVVVTSGLLDALENRGIQHIAEVQVTNRKGLVSDYLVGGEIISGEENILIPQLHYYTNDSWELVGAIDGPNGWPLLHDADYATGQLYILTIPDNFANLYELPSEVLTRIKQTIMDDQFVRLDGPSEISLMAYDNDTFVVESFRDEAADVRIVTDGRFSEIQDVRTNESISGQSITNDSEWGPNLDDGKTAFETTINPHSYRVFRAE